MRKSLALAFAATVALGCLCAAAAGEAPLRNEDVRKMIEAGLPANVIVAKIESSPSEFDTSVEELVALSDLGVDAAVLTAMTQAGTAPAAGTQSVEATVRTAASPAANVRTNFAGTPCSAPGIFLDDGGDGDLRDVEVTSTAQTRTGSGIMSAFTYGIVSAKSKAAIRGARAGSRTDTPAPTFWFCFEESEAGLSYQTSGAVNPSEFLLVAFKASKRRNERTFEIGKFNVWTGGQSGTPPKQLRDVSHEKVAPGVYRVTPEKALRKGEYGFYYVGEVSLSSFGFMGLVGTAAGGTGGKIFAFGVD